MVFPAVTAFYGGLFGLIFVALSVWVVAGRARYRVHHGDGGSDPLQRRIRSQANFAEYVPLALLLVALNEAAGARGWTIHALLLALLVARLAHPFGMTAPEASARQFALRGPAIVVTWLAIAIAAVMLLARAA